MLTVNHHIRSSEACLCILPPLHALLHFMGESLNSRGSSSKQIKLTQLFSSSPPSSFSNDLSSLTAKVRLRIFCISLELQSVCTSVTAAHYIMFLFTIICRKKTDDSPLGQREKYRSLRRQDRVFV